MADELLPCPFCGGEAKREDIEARDGVENAGASYITCARCWASTALHFDRKENLLDSWNRRKWHLSEEQQFSDYLRTAAAILEDFGRRNRS